MDEPSSSTSLYSHGGGNVLRDPNVRKPNKAVRLSEQSLRGRQREGVGRPVPRRTSADTASKSKFGSDSRHIRNDSSSTLFGSDTILGRMLGRDSSRLSRIGNLTARHEIETIAPWLGTSGRMTMQQQQRAAALQKNVHIVQRALRAKRFMYRQFGPLLFARNDGSPAVWGQMSFVGVSGPAVPYIVVSKSTKPSLLASHVLRYWLADQAKPEIILSICGSAQDFALEPRLRRIFAAGLVSWSASRRALFLTAGTSAGVSKLVAATMHENLPGERPPVIGISTLETVKASERLCKEFVPGAACEATYPTRLENDCFSAALDQHHTHQIMIEAGQTGWGREQEMRAKLESELAIQAHAHVVQVVLQGGPGTLDLICRACESGTPVVTIVDTGGAAQAVYQVVSEEISEEEAVKTMGIVDGPTAALMAEKLKQIKVYQEAAGGTLLHFFKLTTQDELSKASELLSMIVMKAIITRLLSSSQPSRPSSKEDQDMQKEDTQKEETDIKKALVDSYSVSSALTLAVTMDAFDAAGPIFSLLSSMAVDRSRSEIFSQTVRASVSPPSPDLPALSVPLHPQAFRGLPVHLLELLPCPLMPCPLAPLPTTGVDRHAARARIAAHRVRPPPHRHRRQDDRLRAHRHGGSLPKEHPRLLLPQ